MTQFMMIATDEEVAAPEGVLLQPAPDDPLFDAVKQHYPGFSRACRLAVDHSGRAEPLVDEVWEAQQGAKPLAETAFGQLTSVLLKRGVEFICWCGSDFRDLPRVRDIDELERQTLEQTKIQPADLYLHFVPG